VIARGQKARHPYIADTKQKDGEFIASRRATKSVSRVLPSKRDAADFNSYLGVRGDD
jgi:hypothetical protein